MPECDFRSNSPQKSSLLVRTKRWCCRIRRFADKKLSCGSRIGCDCPIKQLGIIREERRQDRVPIWNCNHQVEPWAARGRRFTLEAAAYSQGTDTYRDRLPALPTDFHFLFLFAPCHAPGLSEELGHDPTHSKANRTDEQKQGTSRAIYLLGFPLLGFDPQFGGREPFSCGKADSR